MCLPSHVVDWLQERFYFGDTVLPLFESGIPLLRQVLRQLDDSENITVAYPDEGAWKRFHYQFDDYPEVNVGTQICGFCSRREANTALCDF